MKKKIYIYIYTRIFIAALRAAPRFYLDPCIARAGGRRGCQQRDHKKKTVGDVQMTMRSRIHNNVFAPGWVSGKLQAMQSCVLCPGREHKEPEGRPTSPRSHTERISGDKEQCGGLRAGPRNLGLPKGWEHQSVQR